MCIHFFASDVNWFSKVDNSQQALEAYCSNMHTMPLTQFPVLAINDRLSNLKPTSLTAPLALFLLVLSTNTYK